MTVSPMVAGLVLAGGAASRMGGGDKPLLTVGGRAMLQAAIEALGLPNIAISANGDPARFAAFGRPVLPDGRFQGQGPLAGILAGLRWAAGLGVPALLTVPGDMPFLPAGLAQALLPAPKGAMEAATATSDGTGPADGRRHFLVATWPVACADRLEQWLVQAKSRRVRDFAEWIDMKYVAFRSESCDFFANVNTEQDLARARFAAALMKNDPVENDPGQD